MSLSKAISLIQSQNSGRATDSGFGFVTNFGIKSKFKVDLTNFGSFYMDILGLSSREIQNIGNAMLHDVYDPTQFGLPFCEEVIDNSPIIIDMTFEFLDYDSSVFYDSSFVIGIVKELQEIIMSFIAFPVGEYQDDPEVLRCFVLETPIWRNNGHQYQSLRFQFPYTKITKNILNGFVIKELVIGLTDKDFIRKLTKTPTVTDWNVIIEKMGDCVSMYGSKKYEGVAPLLLRSIFGMVTQFDNHDIIHDERHEPYYISYDSCERLNPLDCSLVNQCLLDPNELAFNDKKFNLPLMLSIHFYGRFNQIIPDSIQMGDEVISRPFVASKAGVVEEEDQVAMFMSLIPMVSLQRFTLEHKYYWYTIGRTIFNIYNSSRIGLGVFTEISSQELKPLCEKTWETFGNEYYDIRVVMEYAQSDSPDKFKFWMDEYCKNIIEQAKAGGDMIVAELIKRMFYLEFIYDRLGDAWYYKQNSSLKKDIGSLELKNVIQKRLKVPYNNMKKFYEDARDQAPTPDQKKIYKGLITEVEKFISSLDKGSFLDTVIKSAKCKMYDDNFAALRDENLNLMSNTNCVMECYDKTIAFRPFMMQDYITKNTNVAFPMSYDDNTSQVKYLMKYYGQVFVEPEVYNLDGSHSHLCKSIFCGGNPLTRLCYGELCHHVMKVQSSILLGGNEEKLFTNLIGLPNRSKSKYVEIKENSLGGYCVDLPPEEITIVKGKQAGGANAAVEQAKGARLFNVKETAKHEPIDVSKVKKWTGNDRYYNRTLHKEGGSRCISGKLWHMSNVMGDEPNADEGYNIRKVIEPFLAEWVENAPYDELQQYRQRKFPMDESFSKKIKALAQADLYLMFRFFNVYRQEGLKKQPRLIIETTEKQRNGSDAYYNFIKEKIVIYYINEHTKERDFTKSIGVFDLFNNYTRWYRTFSPSSCMTINQNDFKEEMLKDNRLGSLNDINQWTGIGIRGANQQGGGGGNQYNLKPQNISQNNISIPTPVPIAQVQSFTSNSSSSNQLPMATPLNYQQGAPYNPQYNQQQYNQNQQQYNQNQQQYNQTPQIQYVQTPQIQYNNQQFAQASQ